MASTFSYRFYRFAAQELILSSQALSVSGPSQSTSAWHFFAPVSPCWMTAARYFGAAKKVILTLGGCYRNCYGLGLPPLCFHSHRNILLFQMAPFMSSAT